MIFTIKMNEKDIKNALKIFFYKNARKMIFFSIKMHGK